jgi:hypothetical protein
MTIDKKPNQRFAMIALEMTTDVQLNPGPPTFPVLQVEEDGAIMVLQCPRCSNKAFEPARVSGTDGVDVVKPDPSGRPGVVCLGCPTTQCYSLPEKLRKLSLSTECYRCVGCGRMPQVTMTLSEVNLHCRFCLRLTLHVRQGDAPKPLTTTLSVKTRPSTDAYLTLKNDLLNSVWMNYVDGVPTGSSMDPGVSDFTGLTMNETPDSLGSLTSAMMSILGLEDFNAFALRQRSENAKAGVRARDIERRTGRTWRGIVDLLAKHYWSRSMKTVWVIGGSMSIDRSLRQEMRDIADRLDRKVAVEVMPNANQVRKGDADLRPPVGVFLFVDHTFYDRMDRF